MLAQPANHRSGRFVGRLVLRWVVAGLGRLVRVRVNRWALPT